MLVDDIKKSETALDRAKEVDPKLASVGWNAARLSLKKQEFKKAVQIAQEVHSRHPNDVEGISVLGACLRADGQLNEGLAYLNQAISLQSDYAEAYINRGLLQLTLTDKKSALSDFKIAFDLKPHFKQIWNLIVSLAIELNDFSCAVEVLNQALLVDNKNYSLYSNLGFCLQQLGDFTGATQAYNSALLLNPNCAATLSNNASALKKQGKLEEVTKLLIEALNIEPDLIEAKENLLALKDQLIGTNYIYNSISELTDIADKQVNKRPKYIIYRAIEAFLRADFSLTSSYLKDFNKLTKAELSVLNEKDYTFCSAYRDFIGKLIVTSTDDINISVAEQKIYHVGESHCLSYAHREIKFAEETYQIVPRITFGAKAYHFSMEDENEYKAITRANLESLPRQSRVFVSFGEIDCRASEGILSASKKFDLSIEDIIANVVKGYVAWFARINKNLGHSLHFFNVPAPVYSTQLDHNLNQLVKDVVLRFNKRLHQSLDDFGFDLVDVHRISANQEMYSNLHHHLDSHHLGPKSVEAFENQLS